MPRFTGTFPRFFLVCLTLFPVARFARAEQKIEFNRDIRPILSDNCFACHGPDKNKRKSGLRLDDPEQPFQAAKSGDIAIVRGQPDKSELINRILSTDADEQMPPPEFHKTLTAAQKDLLKKWIAQGAVFQPHWSFIPPKRPEIRNSEFGMRNEKAANAADNSALRTPHSAFPPNPIDALVQKRLVSLGLQASPEADRRTLARRLYFDLIGLPPKPEEVDAFVKDKSPDAYEKLVDRLLASPHYGECMAIGWLDVVRFADTIGYHSDNPRNIWPYRDYVIEAFNKNKPFDQFTIEQIAGDLLPNATQETKVASAFNRLLLTTQEGGAQAKDYEARMLTDRVRAIGAAWLGQTTGCCQCHDHKFDPLTQRDFYSLGAFFADIQEATIGGREEGMLVPDAGQQKKLDEIGARIAMLKKEFDAPHPELADARAAWEKDAIAKSNATASQPKQAIAKGGTKLQAKKGGVVPATVSPKEIADILKIEAEKRTPQQKAKLTEQFKQTVPQLAELRAKLANAEKEKKNLEAAIPKCLVSIHSDKPRTVRILPRGNWMDESGEAVQPALPHYLPQPKTEGQSGPDGPQLTRLDLGRWLVSRDNPLTARVFVNRLWKNFFGIGLSKVLDDLGAQGESPVNPELLDWLAIEFMDGGARPWDVKHIVRTIVTSHTYKQVSTASKELQARDPYNRELARQSRFRVDAELVRDNALSVSGLLAPKIGGPSVKPYQPDDYWENLNFPPRKYESDKGENEYRRGLYTWWQRSFLHPSMVAFDAPSREECCAERNRSNIPQQALVLLNDPTYVEAARVFAARILKESNGSPEQRITWAWRQALQRAPREDELKTARRLLDKHLVQFKADTKAAESLLKTGIAPLPQNLNESELAAWTNVARVILNLHETITRS